MAENYEVFRGQSSASPADISDALGGMEPFDEGIVPLIGAVMTLCHRVAEIEAEVAELRALVTPVTR